MAMPTSAAASAGASLMPSPDHRDRAVALAQRLNGLDLLRRQQFRVRFVETGARARAVRAGAHVARQQDDALDAGIPKPGHRRLPVRPHLIGESDDSERVTAVPDEHGVAPRLSTSSTHA